MVYYIRKELARGGSCIVYDGYYINNSGAQKSVRIKECYPFGIPIERTSDNGLQVPGKNIGDFEECKKRFRESFDVLNSLFAYGELTNSITNSIDIYELNNTLYIVSAVMQGKTLKADQKVPLRVQVSLLKTLAKTIGRLHEQGFLYLDLKPDNIFILDEVTDLVQLFDFDSLLKISELSSLIKCPDFRISYSKGFAAIEQQCGNIRKLGKHTDIYALGAVLYYLIFNTTPTALDSEQGAAYDFGESLYAQNHYSPDLYQLLTEFFHKSIASYYRDRYQDMGEAYDMLCKLEKLADESMPYIISTPMAASRELVGREEEYRWLEQNLSAEHGTNNKLVVAGIGGIGKSALVKKYVAEHQHEFKNIIYLYQNGSLFDSFADDTQVRINGFSRYQEESIEEYGAHKVRALYELTLEVESIIVLDDYSRDAHIGDDPVRAVHSGDITSWQRQLDAILKLPCKMIFVTRYIDASGYSDDNFLLLEEIKEKKELYHLLEMHMGKLIPEEESIFAEQIIKETGGHTLAIELLGKQIANSYLSLQEAVELSREYGFHSIAAERLPYSGEKGFVCETAKEILSALYEKGKFRKKSIAVLKCLAFFGHAGIGVNLLQDMLKLDTKDEINALHRVGMVEKEGAMVSLHPVIAASVSSWEWDEYTLCSAVSVIEYVSGILKTLGKKEEHPVNLLDSTGQMAEMEENLFRNSFLIDMYMNFARGIVKACNQEGIVCKTDAYKELLYTTIINTNADQADFVLTNTGQLLDDTRGANTHALLKLCDYAAYLCESAGNYSEAYHYLQKADWISQREKADKEYVRGIFYEMAWNYYDFVLNGDYFGDDPAQQSHLEKYNEAMHKAIACMKKSKNPKSKITLTRYTLSYAVSLIRSVPEKKRKIDRVFAQIKRLMEKYVADDSEIITFYYMARGWYHTYVTANPECVAEMVCMALEHSNKLHASDLEDIDNIISPAANMFLEAGAFGRAVDFLELAIGICDEHNEELVYLRKRQEMYRHLWELACVMKNEDFTRDVIERVERANRECEPYGITLVNPDWEDGIKA
ncbi:MAG: NB-ARC domain-containing protein [Ruminococcus flavefaciens]|nr:NB-ARC domain-containing protein [Ruminococcus flavefaciens]